MTTVAKAASAQVNARIDPNLKARGDAGIRAAGLTPTRVVHAVWELASRYADAPGRLRACLFPEEVSCSDGTLDAGRSRLVRIADEGPRMIERAYADAGAFRGDAGAEPSCDALLDRAYEERFGEGMGWEA